MFPLVVIVHADVELRVARLIEHRGFSEDDARARIAAQATEEQRRAVADVWLDNSGSAGALKELARGAVVRADPAVRAQPAGQRRPPARRPSWCRSTRPGPIRRAASWPG